jgi:hypothetical protein
MARTNQKLINYHGTVRDDAAIQSGMTKGEIAILHPGSDAKEVMIGTLDNAGSIVWFISSAAVYTAIEAVQSGSSADIDALVQKVEGLSASTMSIESGYTALSAATSDAITSVTFSAPAVSAVTGNYADFQTAITGDAYEKTEGVDIVLDVAETAGEIASATSTSKKLASDYAVKMYVTGVETIIEGEITALNGRVDDLSSGLTALSSTTVYAFSGLTIDSEHSVKTYVDDAVGEAVSKAYVIKGSVDTYAQLDAITGQKEGDVWNVVSAGTSAQTPDEKEHSEGTNWVWVADESPEGGHWDALGGTVDLTNYVTRPEFEPIQERALTALQHISGYSANQYITLTNDNASAFTITQNVATAFGSIDDTAKTVADSYAIQEYVKDMKNSAVTSAYTAASAVSYAYYSAVTAEQSALESRVQTIENSGTYQSGASAVSFTTLTDVTYTPVGEAGHTTDMEHQSGLAAKIEGNALKIDLDCLVIDCGTF